MQFNTNLFSQIIHIIPRSSFAQLVHECGAERHSKGFSSWDQYVAMLFCQFAQAKSLREISDGLAVTCGKLSHLGLQSAPAKSTLAYANVHRPYQLMPMFTVPTSFIRTPFSIYWISAVTKVQAKRKSFVLRISCLVLTLPPLTFV